MKNKSIGKVGKLLVALLIFSALLPIVHASSDTENFGISLPIDYTATPNQPPTVSITSPTEGATVNGTVTITGTASDSDGTVQSVEVKIGSDAWATASGTTSWTFTWDTTGYSDGSYTILARSYDGTNYSTEAQVNVTVNNTTPSDTSASDSESFGISLPIDYTASSPSDTSASDSESFGISLPIDYTAANHAPTITLNSPANGSTDVDINVSLNVTVSDPDGDNMTITFWNWTGSEWISWGQLTNKGNGTYEYKPYAGGFEYNTTYTWRASVNDSITSSNSETWTFTTAAEGETPDQPPTANFTYSADGLTVTFTDTSSDSDGNITSWSWDFGDNTYSTSRNPTHVYSSSGAYIVNLTVTDNNNATDSISKAISVTSTGGGGTITYDADTLTYVVIVAIVVLGLAFIFVMGRRR